LSNICFEFGSLGLKVLFSVYYRHGCPRCGGEISDLELQIYGVCSRCRSNRTDLTLQDVVDSEVNAVVELFKRALGREPWPIQRHWLRRLIEGESFALIAPTGMGKTTLLAIYALYRVLYYGWRVYIVVPTREIGKQIFARLSEFNTRIVGNNPELRAPKIIFYDSSSKNSSGLRDSILKGEFDILITTSAFLSRHYALLNNLRFELVIADDLDSILKSSKNVDRLLRILGFSDEDISSALELVKLKQRLAVTKLTNANTEEIEGRIAEIEAHIRSIMASKRIQFVVSSATGRARGLKTLALSELIGFSLGLPFEYMRNVYDFYAKMTELEHVLKTVVSVLKSGLILVSEKSKIDSIVKVLDELKVSYAIVRSGSKAVDRFRKGEVDILIGTLSYYGALVRGLDEPLRIKFVIIVGVPHFRVPVEVILANPRFLYSTLVVLQKLGFDVSDDVKNVANVIRRLTPSQIRLMSLALRGVANVDSEDLSKLVESLKPIIDRARRAVFSIVSSEGKLVVGKYIIKLRNGEAVALRPDPYTYIQASGRTSRILNGSKTYGVSIVLDDEEEFVQMLESELRKYTDTVEFKHFNEEEFSRAAEAAVSSRMTAGLTGLDLSGENVKTALIIVESPTKARTIASMFGKPLRRRVGQLQVYETVIPVGNRVYIATVAACMGHVADLVTDLGLHGVVVDEGRYTPVYDYISRCRRCGNTVVGIVNACPKCGSTDIRSSHDVVESLRRIAREVDVVFIGTDPDTEGEKIAYDLASLLTPFNRNVFRIEMREITRRAVLDALLRPRAINKYRVEAQIARRVTDRWIGFELSNHLKQVFSRENMGAGRVQSPVLLWVVDSYRENRASRGCKLRFTLRGYRFDLFIEAKCSEISDAINKLRDEGLYIVSVSEFLESVKPPPPYTTDAYLADASSKFRIDVVTAMRIAQQLFEAGLITYHRTDSTRISQTGIEIAREALTKLNLATYFTPRTWSHKIDGEDAHEAIRPTMPLTAEELEEYIISGWLGGLTRISNLHLKIYDMIYRRFLASQMREIVVKGFKIVAYAKPLDRYVEIKVPTTIIEEGFNTILPHTTYPEFAQLVSGGRLIPETIETIPSSRVPLMTMADAVKKMKERGIGRPSTYAKAIENNIRHGYVITSKRVKALIPTKLGMTVADLLRSKFLSLVGEEVTRKLEEHMDLIESGSLELQAYLNTILKVVTSTISRSSASIDSVHIVSNLTESASSTQ